MTQCSLFQAFIWWRRCKERTNHSPPPLSERLEQAGHVAFFPAIIITSAISICKFFSFHISCTQSEMNHLLKNQRTFSRKRDTSYNQKTNLSSQKYRKVNIFKRNVSIAYSLNVFYVMSILSHVHTTLDKFKNVGSLN